MKTFPLIAILSAIALLFENSALAGKPLNWNNLPKPVQQAVIANGGKAGQSVDLENGKKNGKAIYEAPIKQHDGTVADVVILEDGTILETKHDDASDAIAEKEKAIRKAGTNMKFSHSREIDHPYLPLASLEKDVLEGSEGGKKVRIERNAKPELHKTFKISGHAVEAFVVEDREWEDGELAEVALDYFAQDDAGTVFYLGEDVDEYSGGKISSHEGSWLLGHDTKKPGVILPAVIKSGAKFKSEDVNRTIHEDDEIVSMAEDAVTPAGNYADCIKVQEKLADGSIEYKYYAKGVGVVREVPAIGDVRLVSHTTRGTGNSAGYHPLFNGKDLSGWHLRNPNGHNSWSILPGGVLKNTVNNGEHGTDLVSEQKFWNFIAHFEYMTPDGSNSGFYLRGRQEIQILGDYKDGVPSKTGNGAIYNFKAPDKFVTKPGGEWQRAEATIVGHKITVTLNGEKIHDGVFCDKPTGSQLDDNVNEPGAIFLQGDHGTVSFRNIEIKELPADEK